VLLLFGSLVKYRKFIAAATVLVVGVVGAVSLILPTWYTATTVIFPPSRRVAEPVHADLREELLITPAGAAGTGKRPETFYITMMRSRRIGLQLIEEFNLHDVYGLEYPEEVLDELHDRTGFTALVNGLVVITYDDEEPKRAAALLNRHVELLDELNREYTVTGVSDTREFLARQITARKAILEEAELELKRFQEENQVLEIEEQFRTTMKIVTELTADAIDLEAELQGLGYYNEPTSDSYLEKQRKYEAVVAQLEKLKLKSDRRDDLLYSYIPALEEVPGLKLELSRLEQNVANETAVYTRLLKQHEKTRIEEASDIPVVRVMERASVPNLRSRPRHKALIAIGAIVGLGWSMFISVLIGTWRKQRHWSRVHTEILRPIIDDFSRAFQRR
jgi:tyrosine-protein kinase Etk/Wzc